MSHLVPVHFSFLINIYIYYVKGPIFKKMWKEGILLACNLDAISCYLKTFTKCLECNQVALSGYGILRPCQAESDRAWMAMLMAHTLMYGGEVGIEYNNSS